MIGFGTAAGYAKVNRPIQHNAPKLLSLPASFIVEAVPFFFGVTAYECSLPVSIVEGPNSPPHWPRLVTPKVRPQAIVFFYP